MKKLVLLSALLSVNGYACTSACQAVEALTELSEDMCAISETLCERFVDETTLKVGVKDNTGKIVIPAKYDNMDYVYSADENYEPSEMYIKMQLGDMYGIFDKNGKQIIAPRWHDIATLGENFLVRQGSLYGIVDKTGKIIVPLSYEDIKVIGKDTLISQKTSYAILNSNGKPMVADQTFLEKLTEDKLIFCENGKAGYQCGVMDTTGKKVVPALYKRIDNLYYYETDDLPLAGVQNQNDKYALLNVDTNKILTPFIYDGFGYVSEGLMSVKVNEQYGFIDTTGKQVIAPIYDDVQNFDANLAKVSKDGEDFYINKQGKQVE